MRTIFIDSNSNYEKLLNESVILQGENLATEVLFEIPSDMVGYSYAMLFQLGDETPVLTPNLPVNEFNQVSYIITNALTSSVGKLRFELQASDSNGVMIKSTTITFDVKESINGNEMVIIPESYVPWYTQVMDSVNTVVALSETIEDRFSEIVDARNGEVSLPVKINKIDSSLSEKTQQIANLSMVKADNSRIDNIIATPTTVSEQEIIDARQSNASLGANLTSIKQDLATHKEDYAKQSNEGFPSQAKDLKNNKTYTIKLQLSSEGNPQIISKEVI